MDPFTGNEEAAKYISTIGTQEHIAGSIQHLYYDGVKRRREVLRSIENAIYPQQPVIVRSKAEVEQHLQQFVVEDAIRREEHRRKIDIEVHGRMKPLAPVSAREIARRCYDEPFKRLLENRAKHAQQRMYCSPAVDPKLKQRENGWRRCFHSDPVPCGLLTTEKDLSKKQTPVKPASELEECFRRISIPRRHQKTEKRQTARGPRFITNLKYGAARVQ